MASESVTGQSLLGLSNEAATETFIAVSECVTWFASRLHEGTATRQELDRMDTTLTGLRRLLADIRMTDPKFQATADRQLSTHRGFRS